MNALRTIVDKALASDRPFDTYAAAVMTEAGIPASMHPGYIRQLKLAIDHIEGGIRSEVSEHIDAIVQRGDADPLASLIVEATNGMINTDDAHAFASSLDDISAVRQGDKTADEVFGPVDGEAGDLEGQTDMEDFLQELQDETAKPKDEKIYRPLNEEPDDTPPGYLNMAGIGNNSSGSLDVKKIDVNNPDTEQISQWVSEVME